MRNLLWMIVVMSGFVGHIFGSEKNENEVVIFAKVNSGNLNLRYVNKVVINHCNEFNMKAELNSPCFTHCYYRSIDPRTDRPRLIESCKHMKGILKQDGSLVSDDDVKKLQDEYLADKKMSEITTAFQNLKNINSRPIPWSCCVSESDKFHYKLPGDELFSFVRSMEGEDITFIIKLESIFGDRNPQDDIDEFESQVRYDINDEQDLCDSGVLCIIRESKDTGLRHCGHGPNSLFGKKIKAEQEAEQAAQQLEKFYYIYSRCPRTKNLLFSGSLVAFLMYILYQKFYATAL